VGHEGPPFLAAPQKPVAIAEPSVELAERIGDRNGNIESGG